MTRAVFEKVAASVVLVLAVAFVVAACLHTHKVYDPDTEAFGILAFTRVGERDLVIDATFTGVTRRDGRLYSTYDRSQPRGKQACPT